MKAVIFGWKRECLKSYLNDCEKIAHKLTLDGYDIYTGAGSGFMLSANRGSYSVNKDKSFGITTQGLENREKHNNKIIKENFIVTKTFSERKTKLIENYDIIIFFPGGMGTLDEFTEVMNLLKTGELQKKIIILYGYKYWNSLFSWFEFNNIYFPQKYIDGVVDSIIEFNNLYNDLTKEKSTSNESTKTKTIEEIKNYEPIFQKKKNI